MAKEGKIAVFSLAYRPKVGGAEIAIEEIAKRLTNQKFVVFTMRFDATHQPNETIGNVEIVRLCPTWLPIKLKKVMYPILAWKAAVSRANEFSLAWGMMAAHAGLAASWFKRSNPEVPFLLTLQEGKSLEEIDSQTFFIKPIFRAIFNRADAIQCISTYLAGLAQKMAPNTHIEVIPNGVDLDRFGATVSIDRLATLRESLGVGEKDILIVTTSRLVKKNGVDRAIRALPLIPEAVFVIYGEGPDESELREEAIRLGVEPRVRFQGFAGHVTLASALAAADVFVRLSRAEGLGNSFIEAMASGTPVIGALVGGISDFLQDGETGIVVPGEDPTALADAVRKLTYDTETRLKIVENARRMVIERFDWDNIAKQMGSLFASF